VGGDSERSKNATDRDGKKELKKSAETSL